MQIIRRAVERGAGLRLHRAAGNPLRVQLDAHHMRRVLEARLGAVAVAVFVVEGEVVGILLVQRHRALGQRGARLHRDGQVLVLDRHQLGGVLRDRLGLGHHQRHRLADEAHAANWARPVRNGTRSELPPTPLKNAMAGAPFQPVAARSAPVTTSSTPFEAFRLADIDPHDPGMGPVGPDEVAGDLTVEMVIGGVTALARDQAKVFPAASELMLGQNAVPAAS